MDRCDCLPASMVSNNGEPMRSWSSDEIESTDSGSSIDSQVDNSGRRGKFSGRFSSPDLSHAHGEERKIRRSLERKLLSDNGARLSRIERRLLRADQSREGSVSISAFKAALAAESKSGGVGIQSDEVCWLIQKLRGRNGRNVKVLKMRSLLENDDEEIGGGHRSESGKRRQVDRKHNRHHAERRNSTSRRGCSRRRGAGLTEDRGGRADSGGQTTSESDNNSRGGATLLWRSSSLPPAKWAIRRGTVGQWLHDVAAPMVRGERACIPKQQSNTVFLIQKTLGVTCTAAFHLGA